MRRLCRAGRGTVRHRGATLAVVCALAAAGCGGTPAASSTSPTASTLPPATTSTWGAGTTSAPSTSTTALSSTTTATAVTTTTTAAPTTTTTSLPGWWHPVTPESPLRVWVLGDSLAETVGAALIGRAGAGSSVTVSLDYQKGSGLVRSDAFDWPAAAAEGLAKREPEAVVVLLGANDGQALRLPAGWPAFGTPEWDAEYARRVGNFMDLLLGGAGRVYWVGVPIMAATEYDQRVQHINALQRDEALARPGVAYLDAYALFQDEAGGFAWELPDEHGTLVEVRLSDGVHFTGAGADRVARAVLEAITADWVLPGS